ncbi:glycosyltransferase [Photobacterium carnosum]|uniref:glycosyltransferase n=1 Tax=Photobacterium carnosum TaxID=2023717 RepID=UPI001E460E9C|nr:glycosyltransferase [Photobacterium carnosum]MCD9526050.1 glycosyltransferase [Photobacterium carnosum]
MNRNIVFLTESMVGAGGVVRVITTWANYFSNKTKCKVVSVNSGESYFNLNENIDFIIKPFLFKYKILALPINIFLILPILNTAKNSYLIVNKSAYIEPIYFWRKLGFYKNIKLVYFSHGGNIEFEKFYMVRKSTKHRVKMIFDVFDKVVCLFKNTDSTPSVVDDKKISFISNPCPIEINLKSLDIDNKVVTYIGRVTKEKGVNSLVNAWKLLSHEFSEWKLEIIGDGADKSDFEFFVNENNIQNITFYPATNNIIGYLDRASISVLPSLFEGMPMSIIEAKARGCAIISTKTNGGKRLISHNINGLLVEIGDDKELLSSLELLMKDKILRDKLIIEGYKNMDSYLIENIAENWSGVFDNDNRI